MDHDHRMPTRIGVDEIASHPPHEEPPRGRLGVQFCRRFHKSNSKKSIHAGAIGRRTGEKVLPEPADQPL
jgi:hypothetical protein